MKAICLKEYVGNIEEYGVDFISNKTYFVNDIKRDEIYITSESGTDVMLTEKELQEHFKTHINRVKVLIENGNIVCYFKDYISTRNYNSQSWSEKSFCDWCDKHKVTPIG